MIEVGRSYDGDGDYDDEVVIRRLYFSET